LGDFQAFAESITVKLARLWIRQALRWITGCEPYHILFVQFIQQVTSQTFLGSEHLR
jgi:hypothetical protein